MSSVVVVGTQWGDEGKGKLQTSSVKTQKSLPAIKGRQCRTYDSIQWSDL